ncbi:MAG: hypothetical protein KDA21_08670 [Phycisphaerales bacterium]|nr:hypothetical protein [Phycisphaerales bacterium]
MSDDTPRPPRRTASSRSTLVLVTGIWFACLLVGVATLIILVDSMRTALVGVSLVLLALFPVAIATALSADSGRNAERRTLRISHQLEEVIADLRLSDSARAVLSRRQEHELLRRAIEQDLTEGQWDSAHALIQKLSTEYGWREEGEGLQERLERERAATFDRSVHDAVESFERMVRGHHWPEAYAEAARLERLYPDSPRIAGLRERVDTGRLVYRRDLERRFHIAASSDDPDEALAIFRELDLYLTPADAPRFQEEARRVFAQARERLAGRFKAAVQEHRWDQALTLGRRLIEEFPNSKMANEVRDLLPGIEERLTA